MTFEKTKQSVLQMESHLQTFDQQLERGLKGIDHVKFQTDLLKVETVSRKAYKEEKKDLKDRMFKIHTVMDFYSNEFLRLENFMEKYLPLKIQNQISQTLNGVMPANQRGRIKEYEDTKFLELREQLIHDKGLPDLVVETNKIVEEAKTLSPQFNGIELEGPETKGLQ